MMHATPCIVTELLSGAMPRNLTPIHSLAEILEQGHLPSNPLVASRWPFFQHNQMGQERICLPTIMSYPGSFAFQRKVNGNPGEGQLWDMANHCFIEPTLHEKEQLMGYTINDTEGGQATDKQRAERLGQAMDGNTLRWIGAMISAAHTLP